jgi:hypothetical protein
MWTRRENSMVMKARNKMKDINDAFFAMLSQLEESMMRVQSTPQKAEPPKKKPVAEKEFSHYEVTVFSLNGSETYKAFEYDVDDDYIVILPVRGQMLDEKRELDEVLFPRESTVSMKVVKVYK